MSSITDFVQRRSQNSPAMRASRVSRQNTTRNTFMDDDAKIPQFREFFRDSAKKTSLSKYSFPFHVVDVRVQEPHKDLKLRESIHLKGLPTNYRFTKVNSKVPLLRASDSQYYNTLLKESDNLNEFDKKIEKNWLQRLREKTTSGPEAVKALNRTYQLARVAFNNFIQKYRVEGEITAENTMRFGAANIQAATVNVPVNVTPVLNATTLAAPATTMADFLKTTQRSNFIKGDQQKGLVQLSNSIEAIFERDAKERSDKLREQLDKDRLAMNDARNYLLAGMEEAEKKIEEMNENIRKQQKKHSENALNFLKNQKRDEDSFENGIGSQDIFADFIKTAQKATIH